VQAIWGLADNIQGWKSNSWRLFKLFRGGEQLFSVFGFAGSALIQYGYFFFFARFYPTDDVRLASETAHANVVVIQTTIIDTGRLGHTINL